MSVLGPQTSESDLEARKHCKQVIGREFVKGKLERENPGVERGNFSPKMLEFRRVPRRHTSCPKKHSSRNKTSSQEEVLNGSLKQSQDTKEHPGFQLPVFLKAKIGDFPSKGESLRAFQNQERPVSGAAALFPDSLELL